MRLTLEENGEEIAGETVPRQSWGTLLNGGDCVCGGGGKSGQHGGREGGRKGGLKALYYYLCQCDCQGTMAVLMVVCLV